MYPPPNIRSDNISWLYEVLADNWIKLGLPSDTSDSILRGAFYTTLVRPSLRLISLNMNYCAQDNFWLYINSTDPLDQLQWVNLHKKEKKLLNSMFCYFVYSLFNGYNMLKIMKKKFISLDIIRQVHV